MATVSGTQQQQQVSQPVKIEQSSQEPMQIQTQTVIQPQPQSLQCGSEFFTKKLGKDVSTLGITRHTVNSRYNEVLATCKFLRLSDIRYKWIINNAFSALGKISISL